MSIYDSHQQVFERVFNRSYNRAGDSYEKQVTELHPSIFHKGWLACLKELGTPSDHPAWTVVAPSVELLDPPVVYSPLVLLGFNEEEYMNQPAEEDDDANVGAAQGNEIGGGE